MNRLLLSAAAAVSAAAATASADDGWIVLFNGKDTAGWKIRSPEITVTKFVDADGKPVPGARKAKVDQMEVIASADGTLQNGARMELKDGKKVYYDILGKELPGAKVVKVGGRNAIVDKDGKEIPGAKAVSETVPNTLGWTVENGELVCSTPHAGNDIYTEQKFTDFELHVEFQATNNSGVYLQGRYEIQVINSFGAKPKPVKGPDGQVRESLDTHQCGAVYAKIAPSKNMAKPPTEWQSYDVVFKAARMVDGKKVNARVTVIWNGEKVIDDAEIDGPTGAALDGKVLEPGPLLLQGDHGRVAYRNIRIRPISNP